MVDERTPHLLPREREPVSVREENFARGLMSVTEITSIFFIDLGLNCNRINRLLTAHKNLSNETIFKTTDSTDSYITASDFSQCTETLLPCR
jgi:hypothetical protein